MSISNAFLLSSQHTHMSATLATIHLTLINTSQAFITEVPSNHII